MFTSWLRAALLAALVVSPVYVVRADIYTWVDKSGAVNMSNLPPPQGVEVTKVVPGSVYRPPPSPPAVIPDPSAATEVQHLEERVRQLEHELAAARQTATPAVTYVSIPAPTTIAYETVPVQYGPQPLTPGTYGCDPRWIGCGGWVAPVYPPSVIVLGRPTIRHPLPHHGGRHLAPFQGGRGAGWRHDGIGRPSPARSPHATHGRPRAR